MTFPSKKPNLSWKLQWFLVPIFILAAKIKYFKDILIKNGKPISIILGTSMILIPLCMLQQASIGSLNKEIKAYEDKVNGASHVDDKLRLEKDILGFKKDVTTIQNGAYVTIVQLIGGILLGITAWVGYQNFKIGEKNLKVSEDKQVTERFSKSIEHLGSKEIDIRLGGIYALEQIAIDSRKYHWPIVEILSAYIREKCSNNSLEEQLKNVTADIQAALTVLVRRKIEQDPPGNRIDLRKVKLPRVEIPKGNLSRANLSGVNLSEAKLNGANLNGADLERADLSEAKLNGAKLSEAKLSEAKLNGADLCGAELNGADLERADLNGANVWGANLNGANLWRANLERVDLKGASLSGAKLSEANLEGANLSNANLSGFNLSRVNLKEADLSGANLKEANLEGANLLGTNLSRALNLIPQQIKLACCWNQAIYVKDNELENNKKVEELRNDESSKPPTDPNCSRWEPKP